MWNHFDRVNNDAFCKYCKKCYKANSSKYGTKNLNKHLASCMKNPLGRLMRNKKTIIVGKKCEGDPNALSVKFVDFNQERTIIELAKMIITNELSFKFVEYERFRKFMEVAQPYFNISSHVTIARYCIQVFNNEKQLECILFANKQWFHLQLIHGH